MGWALCCLNEPILFLPFASLRLCASLFFFSRVSARVSFCPARVSAFNFLTGHSASSHPRMHQPNFTDPDIARIGPNAIIRVAEALRAADGPVATVFERAGLTHYLSEPPSEMVDEREVIALQQALRETLAPTTAAAINHDAGQRTGDSLLAVRIPKPAQRILKLLPPAPPPASCSAPSASTPGPSPAPASSASRPA